MFWSDNISLPQWVLFSKGLYSCKYALSILISGLPLLKSLPYLVQPVSKTGKLLPSGILAQVDFGYFQILLFLTKESIQHLFVLNCFIWKMQKHPPGKNCSKLKSSGNLPISLWKCHNSLKYRKSSGKLPILVYKSCRSCSKT